MPNKPYNATLTQRARELRKNATKQENRLWYEYLRTFRPRFTRQRIVGSYILDFYCGTAKLAVELDGSQHYEPEAIKYDKTRTRFLESLGIRVIRFANTDIDKSFEGVCSTIASLVNNPRRYAPPPSEEGGLGQPPPSADGTPLRERGLGTTPAVCGRHPPRAREGQGKGMTNPSAISYRWRGPGAFSAAYGGDHPYG